MTKMTKLLSCLRVAVVALMLAEGQAVAQVPLAQTPLDPASPTATAGCPAPALSRMRSHRVEPGETVDDIARQYNLMPTTLAVFNGGLPRGIQSGQTLTIPPFNGRVVAPNPGQTWQEAAATYNTRADVLFEINGCQATVPDRIFVPGVFWQPAPTVTVPADHPLRSYPLSEPAQIIAAFGWQPSAARQELVFNTGVTLAATAGSTVKAAGAGTVAFAGEDRVYGNLVVINHAQGLQTRYANLNSLTVKTGDRLQAGARLGTLNPGENALLQFEVRLNSDQGWIAQDPQRYISALSVR